MSYFDNARQALENAKLVANDLGKDTLLPEDSLYVELTHEELVLLYNTVSFTRSTLVSLGYMLQSIPCFDALDGRLNKLADLSDHLAVALFSTGQESNFRRVEERKNEVFFDE